jgi:hypothetical protein
VTSTKLEAAPPGKVRGLRIYESTGKRLDPNFKRRKEPLQEARERASDAAVAINRRLRLTGPTAVRWAVEGA